jgi:DNA-binding CsgD family transcriptional regulator
MRVAVEAGGVQALPLEVDVILVTEEAVEALLRHWEDQARRGLPLRLPAVLLLSAGAGGAARGGSGGGGAVRGGTGLERPVPSAAERLAALPLPAWGLLGRNPGPDVLAAAVRALHAGLNVNASRLPAPNGVWSPAAALNGTRGSRDVPPLTPRETEVLRLLARGAGNKQIAWELGVSEHTIKFHTSAIYAKLGVVNRTEALRRGVELGLLSL